MPHLRNLGLALLLLPLFPLLFAAAPTSKPSPPSDDTLSSVPEGSKWRGKRTANGDTIVITAKVRKHDAGELVLIVSEPRTVKEEWVFTVAGTHLTLTDVRTTTRDGGNKKNVKGQGLVEGDQIKLEYSWNRFGPNIKNAPVSGQVLLEKEKE